MTGGLVLGGPSVLTEWGHQVLHAAAAMLPDPPSIAVLDRFDPLPAETGAGGLLFCQFPSPAAIIAARSGDLPAVAFLDDPVDCVRYLCAAPGCTVLEALRTQTAAHTIDRVLFERPRILTVRRGHVPDAGRLILEILARLRIDLPLGALAALVAQFTDPADPSSLEAALQRCVPRMLPLAEAAAVLGPVQAALVTQVLAPMVRAASEQEAPPITWPVEMFFCGDRPQEAAPAMVDVTGGARILYYGPYAHLPDGDYRMTFSVAFSAELEGLPLSIQFQAGAVTREARLLPPRAGVFAGTLDVRHTLPQEPIEVILRNDRGAIDGRLALLSVSFDRLPGAAAGSLLSTRAHRDRVGG